MNAGFRCLPYLRKVVGRTSIVAFAIAMLASAAFTQSQNGTLVGLIHDPQHNVITGVEVQLSRADASQADVRTVTDTTGRYQFVGLTPGAYSLALSLAGWQDQQFSDLIIDAGRTLDINIVLLPVTSTFGNHIRSLQLLDRDVWAGTQFGQVSMHKLPTSRRIWSLLENQATSIVTNRLDTGGLETGTRPLFSSRGLSWTENQYSLNGLDVTDPYLPGLPLTDPDFDALTDVTVIRSEKPATFSGSGVNLELITPQTSTDLHGTIRAFFSNHALQSNNMDARLVQLGFPGPERLGHLVDAGGQLSGRLPLPYAKWPFFISLTTQQLSKTLGGFAAPIDAHVYHLLTDFTLYQRGSKQLNL